MKKALLLILLSFCFALNAEESYKDYLKQIENIKKELSQIELDKENEKREAKSGLDTELAEKLNEIEQKEFPKYEKPAVIEQKKQEMREDAQNSYNKNLQTKTENIETEYKTKFENAKARLEAEKSIFKSNIFREDKTEIYIGEFEVDPDPEDIDAPQYWPVIIKSRSDDLSFEYEGKIYFSGVDKEKEWDSIENNRGNFTARISYVAVEGPEDVFSKRIKKIEIMLKNNSVIEKFDVDLPESPVKKSFAVTNNEVSTKSNESSQKITVKSDTSVATKKESTSKTKNDYKREEKNEWRSDDWMFISFTGLWGFSPLNKSTIVMDPQIGMDWKAAEILYLGFHLSAPLRFDSNYNYQSVEFDYGIDFGFSLDYFNLYLRFSAFGIVDDEDALFKWNIATPVIDVRLARWLNLTSEIAWLSLKGDEETIHIKPDLKIGASIVIGVGSF